jgi:hypothetical protein
VSSSGAASPALPWFFFPVRMSRPSALALTFPLPCTRLYRARTNSARYDKSSVNNSLGATYPARSAPLSLTRVSSPPSTSADLTEDSNVSRSKQEAAREHRLPHGVVWRIEPWSAHVSPSDPGG